MPSYQDYVNIVNNRPEGERYYECFILSNPHFSKTYYLVADNAPLTAFDNTGVSRTYEPASIKSTNAQNSDDLSQTASITIADPFNQLDDELDRVPLGNDETLVTFVLYASTDLTEPSEWLEYEGKTISQKAGVFTVKLGVPDLNDNETGEIYDYDTFPMLRSI